MDDPKNAHGLEFGFLSQRHIPEIIRIENASYGCPWTAVEMARVIASPDFFGIAATQDKRIVGYAIWAAAGTKITIQNLAVDPAYRRIGVGRELVERVKEKVISVKSRTRIDLLVSEQNLAAQLFFKHCGFRAVATLRDHYKPGDAYRMLWRKPTGTDG